MQRRAISTVTPLPAEFKKLEPKGIADSPALQSQRQRLEAIGRLVSGVAHDFNNLLTGIRLYCDLMTVTLAGIGEVEGGSQRQWENRLRQYTEEIRKASDHGAALTRQLTNLVEEQVPSLQLLSWNEAILDLRNLLERLIGENIRLVTELAGDLEPTRIDPAQIHQLILNLVLNARDAMPNGGQITIATRNHSEYLVDSNEMKVIARNFLEFTVTDTGFGMDSKTRQRAFEPFYTTKEPGKGSGLGLSTVRKIVNQYNGTIQVESEVGKGTRVTVRIPRPAADLVSRKFPETTTPTELDH